MMEAQRYPKDFDGIVAGAPAFHWTGLAAKMISIAKALYPDPAHLEGTVLTKEALQKLQAGILEQCDAQDGLKDGVIQNPASVHFDLSKVPELTDEQRKVIEVIYQGARNERGAIYPGFAPVAECDPDQWIAWITGPAAAFAKDHVPDLTFAFSTQIFKYLVFNDPDWNYATYNFSNFEREGRLAASFLNATNPDLSAFKARNGKLILWHGWADPALPAQENIRRARQVLEDIAAMLPPTGSQRRVLLQALDHARTVTQRVGRRRETIVEARDSGGLRTEYGGVAERTHCGSGA